MEWIEADFTANIRRTDSLADSRLFLANTNKNPRLATNCRIAEFLQKKTLESKTIILKSNFCITINCDSLENALRCNQLSTVYQSGESWSWFRNLGPWKDGGKYHEVFIVHRIQYWWILTATYVDYRHFAHLIIGSMFGRSPRRPAPGSVAHVVCAGCRQSARVSAPRSNQRC